MKLLQFSILIVLGKTATVNLDGKPLPRSHFTKLGFLAPEDSFQFQVVCDSTISQHNCSLSEKVLRKVGVRIANEILLLDPVRILVEFKPILNSNNTVSQVQTNSGWGNLS